MAFITRTSDSFNRANGALDGSALDNAGGGGEANTWTLVAGAAWAISSNQCANPDVSQKNVVAVLSTGDVDEQRVSVVSRAADGGVLARFVSGGYGTYYVLRRLASGEAVLYRFTGSFTQLGSIGPAIANGDTIAIYCLAGDVSGYINGALVLGPTAGGGNAAGKPGLYSHSAGTALFDDFLYEAGEPVVAGAVLDYTQFPKFNIRVAEASREGGSADGWGGGGGNPDPSP